VEERRMNKLRDLTGQRFGRLFVIERGGMTNSGGHKWWVRCDCGRVKEIASDHLVRAVQPVISCGCYRNDRIREVCASPDESAFKAVLGSYKKRAALKRREFSLTEAEFRGLTTSNCNYCGKPPSTVAWNKAKSGQYLHNGIDRVDSALGYEVGNCVPCCKLCNYMKRAHSKEEFISHVMMIAAFQQGGRDA
jgi:hypothetical protein